MTINHHSLRKDLPTEKESPTSYIYLEIDDNVELGTASGVKRVSDHGLPNILKTEMKDKEHLLESSKDNKNNACRAEQTNVHSSIVLPADACIESSNTENEGQKNCHFEQALVYSDFNCNREDYNGPFEKWERDHILSSIAMCGVVLIQAYLVVGVLPYAGYMTIHLFSKQGNSGITKNNVGTYAGALGSAFMVGRFFSALAWGDFADKYGRRRALLLSVSFSGLFSLLFGMSTTYRMAVCWRFFLGLSNSLTALAKTLVSDLAKGDHILEEQTMGLVFGVWAYGFLFCPGISGLLAEPLQQYPGLYDALSSSLSWKWFKRMSVTILETYPFILPNIFAFLGCIIVLLLASAFLPETVPNGEVPNAGLKSYWKKCKGQFSKLMPFFGRSRRDAYKENQRDCFKNNTDKDTSLMQASSGQCSSLSNDKNSEHDEVSNRSQFFGVRELCTIKNARDHLIVEWIFLFYTMMLDTAFPLFCMSFLGLPEYKIGEILTGAGMLFILGQYPFYALLMRVFGLYGTTRITVFLMAPLCLSVPFSTWINSSGEGDMDNNANGTLNVATFAYLSTVFAMYKITVAAFHAAISVAINRTVDESVRASTNAVGTMFGSIFRAAGPIIAGLLFTASQGLNLGGFAIFGAMGAIGVFFYGALVSFNERGFEVAWT